MRGRLELPTSRLAGEGTVSCNAASSALGESRTLTEPSLNRLPLPIGLQKHVPVFPGLSSVRYGLLAFHTENYIALRPVSAWARIYPGFPSEPRMNPYAWRSIGGGDENRTRVQIATNTENAYTIVSLRR